MTLEIQQTFANRLLALNAYLAHFRSDQRGNVAMVFGLMAIVLMLAVGAAIDIGRWLHARDQTVAAVDAAVLAGGRQLQTDNTDTAAALAAAQKFYTQNIASRLPVIDDSISFAIGGDGISVTANGFAYIKTPFLQLANIDKLPLFGTGQQPIAVAQLAAGGNGGESVEVAMMLDITGSMAGQKLQDLKDSASDLINIVVWDDQSKYTSKVAIVPFSEDIRLPTTTALGKARSTTLPSSKSVSKTTYYLSDCVVERTGTQKYTDTAPGAGQYVMGHYTTSSTGSGSNKKGVCTIPAGAEVMPLTSDKTSLLAKVTGLTAAGGTAGHLGTAWAWYTLAPNWSSLWPASTPAAYGTDKLEKIALLMTDGEYNTQYDSNGISANQNATSCPQAANGCSTDQARALCTAMKAKGIVVYTVGFQVGNNQTAVDTLTQCATDPSKFYNAADGNQLRQAFRDIALKLSSLYLSK
jgi:Putative Flp pilus-assembly TadE/G-like